MIGNAGVGRVRHAGPKQMHAAYVYLGEKRYREAIEARSPGMAYRGTSGAAGEAGNLSRNHRLSMAFS